jgi:hypothetical protein
MSRELRLQRDFSINVGICPVCRNPLLTARRIERPFSLNFTYAPVTGSKLIFLDEDG